MSSTTRLAGHFALAAAVAIGTGFAHAQSQVTFDLPAQSLADSLIIVAHRTDTNIYVDRKLVEGRKAPALKGVWTAKEAAQKLLEGSGLTLRQIDERTWALVRIETSVGIEGSTDLRLARVDQSDTAAAPLPDASSSDDALEEIIVTAQKREEPLQDVPLSISVFTRNQIEKSGIVSFEDYANFTPGVNVELGSNVRTYEVTIRGIGALGGQAHNFGLYLDEFELTGASAGSAGIVSADLSDVERIEVLRGPQGTAFGRNVIAGAVNLTSIAPSTERLSGSAEVGVSNHGGRALRGSLNLPIVEDLAALRVNASYRSTNGYLRNSGPSGQSNDYESRGFRAALRLTPLGRLKIDVAVAMQRYDQGLGNSVGDGNLLGTIGFLKDVMDAGQGALPPGTLPAGPPAHYPSQNKYIETDTRTFGNSEVTLSTLRGEYELDGFSIVSVSGYARSTYSAEGDYDGSAFNLFIGATPYDRDSFWSTELRVQSGTDAALSWIGGLYYSRGESDSRSETSFGSDTELITFVNGLGPLFPNDVLLFANTSSGSESSKAAFAELKYRMSRRWSVVAGLRHNDDSAGASQRDGWNLLGGGPLPDDAGNVGSTKMTWRASLIYEPWDAVNYYATTARGYRAGGIQLFNQNRPNYGPEAADNYELGVKAFLLDRRLGLNASAFYTDWRDVQILTFDFATGGQFTDNVGRAQVYGAELEARAALFTGLELIAGASLLHTEIVDYVNGDGDSFAGFRLPNTPRLTASLVADYEYPLFAGVKGFVRGSYLHVGDRLESVVDASEQEFLPEHDLVDLRVGLRGERWMVEAYGQNVFDEIYSGGVLLNGFSLSGSGVTSPRPSFGLRALRDF